MASRDANFDTEEAAVDAAERVRERRIFRERSHVAKAVATYEGRFLLWQEMTECGVYSTSFSEGNPHLTSYNEGRRSVGLALLDLLFTVDPSAYTIMRQEAEDRDKLEQLELKTELEKETESHGDYE